MADEIEVELEAPQQVNGVVVVTPDEKVTTPDPAVEDLREQLKAVEATAAAEKNARTAAETQARERQAEIDRLKESETASRAETVDSQLDAVSNAINAAKAESENAKRALAAAGETGDWAKVAEAQEQLADARAKLLSLGQSRVDLEQAKKTPVKVETRTQAPVDQTEAFIQSRTPATQTWLRSHMEVLTNPQLNAIAVGADAEAQRKKIAADSPEYFALVETRLGYRQEETVVVEPEIKPETRQQKQVVRSAPVSREPNTQSGGRQKITLTPGEQQVATDGTHVWTRYDEPVMAGKIRAGTPIGIQEFARRKAAMLMNGDYSRHDGDEA